MVSTVLVTINIVWYASDSDSVKETCSAFVYWVMKCHNCLQLEVETMKKIVVGLLVAIFGIGMNSFGELLEMEQGTREIALQGAADLASEDGRSISATISLGYFIASRIEIGALGGYAENSAATAWNAGVFTEWNFDVEGKLMPFVGGAAKYYKSKATESMPTTTIVVSSTTNEAGEAMQTEETTTSVETTKTEDEAAILDAKAGVKYFFTEDVALSVAYVASFATKEIYWDDDKRQDTDTKVEFAIRYFF